MNTPGVSGFAHFGDFLASVRAYYAGAGERTDGRLAPLVCKTALAEGTDSIGGFTVPAEFSRQIINAALEGAIVRPLCRNIVPMSTDKVNVPIVIDADRSSSMFGGIIVSNVKEAEDRGASPIGPALGQLGLTAHETECLAFVSNRLMDDWGNLGTYMQALFASALRFYQDHRYIWGTGVGEPLGVMPSGAMLSVARVTHSGAPKSADLAKMISRLLPGALNTAVWLVSQNVLADWGNDSTSGANAYGAIDLSGMTAFGRPIRVTEKCAASGSTGDVILADFTGGYAIGERDFVISTSREVNYSSGTNGWLKNETCWRFIVRGDGQPILPAAITPYKGGETLSHFVTLTTAS
jgi:HK97 family phage major capsid protein